MTETTKPPVSTVDTGGFQISALMCFFNPCKKKSGKLWNSLPLYCVCRISFKYASYLHLGHKNIISHIQHFINAFQPVAYRRPAIVCLCCNVRQREPLNVPQKSYLSVYPPKRCAFDSGGHLLSVKSLQRRGQHYASRRHRQHRARKAAAAVRRCAPYCQARQTGDEFDF